MNSRIVILFLFITSLYSQSIWEDSNPYSTGQNLKIGSIIKVEFKDNFQSEYFYESNKDDTHTIKNAPDKKIIPEMTGYHSDRSIAQKGNGKSKSKNKIIGTMSAIISEKDEETGNYVLSGTRTAQMDDQLYELKVSGVISSSDLKENKTVSSESIANLKLELRTSPVKKSLTDPDIQMKSYKDRSQKDIPKAEVSDEEKQKILLKNMKRMLGESE